MLVRGIGRTLERGELVRAIGRLFLSAARLARLGAVQCAGLSVRVGFLLLGFGLGGLFFLLADLALALFEAVIRFAGDGFLPCLSGGL